MPQCNKCGKKGLFLKIEEDSGLCLACNAAFSSEGKALTARIMDAKNKASRAEAPEQVREHCRTIEEVGEQLLDLHKRYGLEPSQELLDLIATYRKMGERAGGRSS
jgi:hypothetical protein